MVLQVVFAHRTSFRAKGLLQDKRNCEIAILPQFLRIEPHFVRKGCSRTNEIVKSQFYLSFCASTLISCEKVAPGQVKSQFYLSFCASTFRAKGLLQDKRNCEIAILPQFLRIDPHFVRKGCSGPSKIAILPQFLRIDISCERVAPAQVKSQVYLSFCASNLISCERVAPGQTKL